jgi:phage I-like protein
MADYAAHGIDIMLDYDHASLDTNSAPDPAQAGKAAGWCSLEVRNGELWAVNVRWTEPAAEALRRKEWRFMSPAFTADASGRILSLINVAITNLPATRRLEPLMAASRGETNMSPDLAKKALDALTSGDGKAALDIIRSLIASAAAGDSAPATSHRLDARTLEICRQTGCDPAAFARLQQRARTEGAVR